MRRVCGFEEKFDLDYEVRLEGKLKKKNKARNEKDREGKEH